jgi:putative transport protein
MLAWLEQFLVRYPELALFLVIAAGYWIGSFKFGAFSLGPVTGALFAGLFVGQFAHVPVSGMTKSFLFLLFLFGIGYSVGPQFMQALKRDGLKPILLAVVVCITGLIASIVVAKLLQLDAGFAAGLMSGALTHSAAMGTATDAVNGLALPESDRLLLVAHIAVADAVCYIFGYAGVILFCTVVAPALLKIDLKAEALKLETSLGMTRSKPGVASAWRKFELRAYRLPEGAPLVGTTIAVAEARLPEHRLFILRLRRGERILEAEPTITLDAGDVIAVSGPRQIIVELVGARGEEVEDKELLDIPVTAADILLMNPELAGRNLEDVSREDWTRGLYLRSIKRGDQEIPIAAGVVLLRGDLLRVVGPEPVVQNAATKIGTIIAPSSTIDFVVLGLAIFLGGLIGVLATFSIAGVKISLSTSVGTLLAGLLVGHLRTRYPLFGRIPEGAVALMTSLGLAAFVGLTGIHAGPIFISALKEVGVGLLLGGIVVTLFAADGWLVLRPLCATDEPDPSPRSLDGGADSDCSDGSPSGAFRQPGRGSRLHAGLPNVEYPADDVGNDHGSFDGQLNHRIPIASGVLKSEGARGIRKTNLWHDQATTGQGPTAIGLTTSNGLRTE